MADAEVTDAYCIDRMVFAGGVETVVARLLRLIETVGPFGGLLAAFHDWDPRDAADEAFCRRSMVLLAEEVMPRLRAEIA